MRTLLIVSTLALTSGHCSASDPGEIIEAWSTRAEAVKQGEIRWTVPLENWSVFGRFETEWVPESDEAEREMGGRLRFDEQRARYDSTSFSFTEYAALSAQQTAQVRFQVAAMVARFQDRRYAYGEQLPYTLMYRPDRGEHFWHDRSNERPLALILPAGPAMGLPYLSSFPEWDATLANAPAGGFSAYFHHLLAAPALLAFRPFLFDDRLRDREACEIDERLQPVHKGRTCRVLRVAERINTDQSTDASTPVETVYWVDPSRDFIVLRCIIIWNDAAFAQIDIQYKAADKVGWLPSTWSVLRFGESPNTVQQVATAVMEDVDLEPGGDEDELDTRVPPGTWVVDRVTARQYVVRDDFSEQEIDQAYRFPADSYATLIPQVQARTPIQSRILQVLLPLIRWPGVVVPVMIIFGVLLVTRRVRAGRESRL